MKKLTKTLALTAFLLCGLNANAQNFELPENYQLKNESDYAKYEPTVLEAIDWLMNTPVIDQKNKRKDVNAFVTKWIMGSPTVSIEISQKNMKFFESENKGLMLVFMMGWTKYSISTKDYNNKLMGNLSGVEALIDFYQNNKNYIQKEKNIEKYIKLQSQGKLKDFVEKNI
jgi:hypothetical protein